MTSAADICKRNGIDFLATKSGKFTTNCPNCGGGGYLNVETKKDGVVWFCHDCNFGGGEPFNQDKPKTTAKADLGQPKAVYDYCDEGGNRLFQSVRYEPVGQPKVFRQRTGPDQDKWSIKGVRIVPYRLPELLADLANDHVVVICEGEKDVDSLRSVGVPATTNPMGAGKWRAEFNAYFKDADVVLCGDNDQPGREHIAKIAASLYGVARRVRVLDLAEFWLDIEPSQDISDWLKGHDVDQLWHIIADLPDYKPTGGNGNGTETTTTGLGVLSVQQFLDGFVPPDYLVQGILQRRFIYAVTGQTGHAKTAVALLVAQLVSSTDKNAMLGSYKVEKGRAIYFAGENPDDLRMRVIGSYATRLDEPERDDLWFIPGVFPITGMMHAVNEDCKVHGDVSLIIVDTSAAYFLGDDEISNTQMGNYARQLRALTTLPGGPCVLVLCHPIKHTPEPDQLLPRGGGAYLAEVDGNLTLWKKTDELVELSYTKMRGPGFQPITFRLDTIRTPALADAKGNQLPTVQAIAIAQSEEEKIQDKAESEEDRLLAAVLAMPNASMSAWAAHCAWVSETGTPYKMKVQRILQNLNKVQPRLTVKKRSRWILTDDGKAVAREAALKFEREAEDRSQVKMF